MAKNEKELVIKIRSDGKIAVSDLNEVKSKVKELSNEIERTGDKGHKALSKIKTGADKIKKGFSAVKATVGAVAAVIAGSFVVAIKETINFGNKLDDLSKKLGATTANLSRLSYIASQSGISFETMSTGIQRMVRRISEAANGTGEASGALRELGLDAEKLNRLKPFQQLMAIADAMKSVNNQQDKLRLAFKLFDTEGVTFLQFMDEGSEGMLKMAREADQLGITISSDTAKAFAKLNQEFDKTKAATRGVFIAMSKALIPVVQALNKVLIGAIKGIRAFSDALDRVFGITTEGQITQLERRIRQLSSMPKVVRDAFKAGGADIDEYREKLKKLKEELNRENKQLSEGLDTSKLSGVFNDRLKNQGSSGSSSAISNKLKTIANQIKQLNMTPLEKLEQRLAIANDLFKKKMISEETYRRHIERLGKEYNNAIAVSDEYNESLKQEAEIINERNKPALQVFMEELARLDDMFKRGLISQRAYVNELKKIGEEYNKSIKTEDFEDLISNGEIAARSTKEAFNEFLFDPFDTSVKGMAATFLKAIQRMAATNVSSILFGKNGTGGILGSLINSGVSAVSNFISTALVAALHTGGIVGRDGFAKPIGAGLYGGITKYHTGGIAGLAPDEQLTVLKKGEEVLTRSDPRHRYNVGGQSIVINVQTNDADSFKESESQIGTRLALELDRWKKQYE